MLVLVLVLHLLLLMDNEHAQRGTHGLDCFVHALDGHRQVRYCLRQLVQLSVVLLDGMVGIGDGDWWRRRNATSTNTTRLSKLLPRK